MPVLPSSPQSPIPQSPTPLSPTTAGARFSDATGVRLDLRAEADLQALDQLEWVEPDGCGGYAHGTVSGRPTRRYHALLVLPLLAEAKRHVLLGHVDERVDRAGAASLRLTPVRRADPGADDPLAPLRAFELCPWPAWTFRIGQTDLRRELLVDRAAAARGRPCTLLRYTHAADATGPLTLRLDPFLPYREADALTFANDVLDGTAAEDGPLARRLRAYPALPPVRLALDAEREPGAAHAATWVDAPRWIHGIELTEELRRGYDGHEDRFSPGGFTCRLEPGESVVLECAVEAETPSTRSRPADAWARAAGEATARWERERRGRTTARALHDRAAEAFLYAAPLRSEGSDPALRTGVLAGFPWFGEWGRDVFLSLPGLTLARGDRATCAAVRAGALAFLEGGLLPNIYGPTRADSHYGSVDASLWFARAARLFRLDGGDPALCRGPLREGLREIHAAYAAGTALGIRSDGAGLVLAGGPDLNPTWMDAQTSKGPVTPRAGCPVEIAALWILLLEERLELADPGERADLTAERDAARAAFRERFWDPASGRLHDLWTPRGVDRALRPNAVLAAAMDTTPLTPDEAARFLTHVDAELLTPVGLRTLSPGHPDYVARYAGGPDERDGAYHQGTVWPWLLGGYVELCLRARAGQPGERTRLTALLDGLDAELLRAGLGHVSEVFDADPPHAPGGTIAQAWSTAELLRARALVDALDSDPTTRPAASR